VISCVRSVTTAPEISRRVCSHQEAGSCDSGVAGYRSHTRTYRARGNCYLTPSDERKPNRPAPARRRKGRDAESHPTIRKGGGPPCDYGNVNDDSVVLESLFIPENWSTAQGSNTQRIHDGVNASIDRASQRISRFPILECAAHGAG
jgi:hypothetical protein